MGIEVDEKWMHKAIEQAQLAEQCDEVPVGAILIKDEKVIGVGHNRVIKLNDPTAHAEIMALRDAGQGLENYRLPEATLYVTLEPCLMCVGAMVHARIKQVVFGAYDPKTGAVFSQDNALNNDYHNHTVRSKGGVLEAQCSEQLKTFFQKKRKT